MPGPSASVGGGGQFSGGSVQPSKVANGKPSGGKKISSKQNTANMQGFLDKFAPQWTEEFTGPQRRGPRGGGRGGQGKVAAVGEFEYDPMAFGQFGGQLRPDEYQSRDFTGSYDYGDFTPEARFQAPQEASFNAAFQAPTGAEAAASPGYDFRLREGQRAIENAAAAKGMLRTGNTYKDLMKYGQDYATAEYDKTYGRARSEHDLTYGRAQDRYGRALGEQQQGFQQGAQSWQMNQQNQMAQYDRAFQAQQANEANRIGAQQMSEASRAGAFGANLGAHQANFGIESGVYDRNYAGNLQQYDYRLQRAQDEASRADAAASRRESAYNADYRRAQQRYGMRYDISRENASDQFGVFKHMTNLGLSTEKQ